MAWIDWMPVPIEVATKWKRAHSDTKISATPPTHVKIKRNSRKPNKKPKAMTRREYFRKFAALIWTLNKSAQRTHTIMDFVHVIATRLSRGDYPPEYLRRVMPTTSKSLASVPFNTPDDDPHTYQYRDEFNTPTHAFYPDGTETTDTPHYVGHTIDTVWNDELWVWRNFLFQPKCIKRKDALDRILIRWVTTINVTASIRGSRPMFSLVLDARLLTADDPRMTSGAPPLDKPYSIYYRKKVPSGQPPYVNTSLDLRVSIPAQQAVKKPIPANPAVLMIDAGNRPMLGHAYNNSTMVLTSFNEDPEVFEIRTCNIDPAPLWATSPSQILPFVQCAIWVEEWELFIAAGSPNLSYCPMTSPDGITWSETFTVALGTVWAMAYSPALDTLIAVGNYQNAERFALTGPNLDWQPAYSQPPGLFFGACWSPELSIFVAVGYDGNIARTCSSSDGSNWICSNGPPGMFLHDVCWSARLGLFIAVAEFSYSEKIMTSTDGMIWTPIPSSLTQGWFRVIEAPELGLLLAVSYDWFTPRYALSEDGTNWLAYAAPAGIPLSAAFWAPEPALFFVFSNINEGSQVSTSPDGITWTSAPSPRNGSYYAAAWSPSLCRGILIDDGPSIRDDGSYDGESISIASYIE